MSINHVSDPILSDAQTRAYRLYRSGQNVFITGPGGTGKSLLIRTIYQDAIRRDLNINVCALTGCAAATIGCDATTLHRWAGIGLAQGTDDEVISRVTGNRYRSKVWRNQDILIIDEVSMMDSRLFSILDRIGRQTRGKLTKPFGGMQVIFAGDFYQLPPVVPNGTPTFCFENEVWGDLFRGTTVELTQIFRQTDPVWQTVLNEIRHGRLRRSSYNLLKQKVGIVPPLLAQNPNLRPTKLFPTREAVSRINQSALSELTGAPRVFVRAKNYDIPIDTASRREIRAQATQHQIDVELDCMVKNLPGEHELLLKEGAQVMCLRNYPDLDICNGSQGYIVGFDAITGYPMVSYASHPQPLTMEPEDYESGTIPGIGWTQIPLTLSWAMTIHKAQGATLDLIEVDVGKSIFEFGQTYVAVSRVKTLDGLYLTAFDPNLVQANDRVTQYYASLSSDSTSTSLPSDSTSTSLPSDPTSTSLLSAESPSIFARFGCPT